MKIFEYLSPFSHIKFDECVGPIFTEENFAKGWDTVIVTPGQLSRGKVACRVDNAIGSVSYAKVTENVLIVDKNMPRIAYVRATDENPVFIPYRRVTEINEKGKAISKSVEYLIFRMDFSLVKPEYIYLLIQTGEWKRILKTRDYDYTKDMVDFFTDESAFLQTTSYHYQEEIYSGSEVPDLEGQQVRIDNFKKEAERLDSLSNQNALPLEEEEVGSSCGLKGISFRNFRKFVEFPKLNFGEITMFVGGNNAGKSTVVKALLLIDANLRSMKGAGFLFSYNFRFDANGTYPVKIGTFERALHQPAERQEISFSIQLGHFLIDWTVAPNYFVGETSILNKDHVSVPIKNIVITHLRNGAKITADISTGQYILDFSNYAKSNNQEEELLSAISHKNAITARISECKDINEISSLNQELAKVETLIKSLKPKEVKKEIYTLPLGSVILTPSETMIENLIGSIPNLLQFPNFAKEKKYQAAKKFIEGNKSFFEQMKKELNSLVSSVNLQYIFAHAATQNAIYVTENQNDYIAKTIHEFYINNVMGDVVANKFMSEWMMNLELGMSLEIIHIEGGAYRVTVVEKNGIKMPLADKGMGSIQLIVLLMRIATIIKTHNESERFGEVHLDGPNPDRAPIIIIEEPELNLHPKMQSKLARLFYEANKEFGLKFIIETHSEYLIRNSQTLVKKLATDSNITTFELLDEVNPFKVYYFPEKGLPYDMEYRPDGKFAQEFGTGFFDEASNLAFDLF